MGSDLGIHFRDQRACLVTALTAIVHANGTHVRASLCMTWRLAGELIIQVWLSNQVWPNEYQRFSNLHKMRWKKNEHLASCIWQIQMIKGYHFRTRVTPHRKMKYDPNAAFCHNRITITESVNICNPRPCFVFCHIPQWTASGTTLWPSAPVWARVLS